MGTSGKNICGKHSLFVYSDIDKRGFVRIVKCKQFGCPNCTDFLIEVMKGNIRFYSQKHRLHFFNTITRSEGYEDLEDKWNKLSDHMRDYLNKAAARRKNPKYYSTDESLEKWLQNQLKKEIKKDVEIEASILARYEATMTVATKKGVFFKKIKNEEDRKWAIRDFAVKHKTQIDREHKKIRNLIISKRDKYSNTFDDIEQRIRRRFMWNLGQDFEYIAVIEMHKSGKPHKHFLSNLYIPHSVMQKLSTETNYVYDNSFICEKAIEQNPQLQFLPDYQFDTDVVSAYVSKITNYLTKDSIETYKAFKEDGNPFSSSHSIKLFAEKEGKSHYEVQKRFNFAINATQYEYDPKVHGSLDKFAAERSNLKKDEKSCELMKQVESFGKLAEEDLKWNYIIKQRLQQISKSNIEKLAITNFVGLDATQSKVLKSFFEKPVTILIGKAGTGKSYTLAEIIKRIPKDDVDKTLIVSFTGKAGSRIRELLIEKNIQNFNPMTIHKACGSDFKSTFLKNELNVLDIKNLIIDEVGMVSREHLAKLLLAIPTDVRVLMAGDDRQLPAVNDVSILPELRTFSRYQRNIKTIELKKIYRSVGGVLKIAHGVLARKIDKVPIKTYNGEEFEDLIIRLLKSGYQILANTRKLTKDINLIAQRDKHQIVQCFGDYRYNVGDKVMICRNNSALAVSNGDTGIISDYDDDGLTITLPDGREVTYEYRETEQIMPCYCLTVHKSQGSEYKKVALFLDEQEQLNTNNLVYTAVTRAKIEVDIYVTDEKILKDALLRDATSTSDVTLNNVEDRLEQHLNPHEFLPVENYI